MRTMARKYSSGIVGYYQKQADKRAREEKEQKEAARKAKERKFKAGLRSRQAAGLRDAFGIPAGRRLSEYDQFRDDSAALSSLVQNQDSTIGNTMIAFQDQLQMLLGRKETDKDRATLLAELQGSVKTMKDAADGVQQSMRTHIDKYKDFPAIAECEQARSILEERHNMYVNACNKLLGEEMTPAEQARAFASTAPKTQPLSNKPKL